MFKEVLQPALVSGGSRLLLRVQNTAAQTQVLRLLSLGRRLLLSTRSQCRADCGGSAGRRRRLYSVPSPGSSGLDPNQWVCQPAVIPHELGPEATPWNPEKG